MISEPDAWATRKFFLIYVKNILHISEINLSHNKTNLIEKHRR